MFERAKAHRDAHITDAHNYDEFCDAVENKPIIRSGVETMHRDK